MKLPYLIHKKLRFYRTPEYFYFIPVEQNVMNQVLSINRLTNQIDLFEDSEAIERSLFCDIIYGIFGMIKLISGYYLILISEATVIGEMYSGGGLVYRIENVKMISFNSDLLPETKGTNLTFQQSHFEKRYLLLLESALKMPNYYFSYNYDLSSSVQRAYRLQAQTRTLIKATNPEFVWNNYLLSPLMSDQRFHYFCLPIICGFISIHLEVIKNKLIRLILISRRNIRRAGTRWFARGINSDGFVANFIETEQILFRDQDSAECFSLVQVRGSIPIFWSQLPNLRYKPPFIIPKAPHIQSYGHHVRRLSRDYGRLCFVNLIHKTGSEGKINTTFAEVINDGNFNCGNDIPFVNFESFDFHNECKRSGWKIGLQRLLDQIISYIDEYGYFHRPSENESKPTMFQQGVIRTNCIDSLDRTNVVQSLIAKHVLRKQMIQFGLINPTEYIEDFKGLNKEFANIWADHADTCSIQYAGTGALKSDFTRTGKRRFAGVIADGLNSLIRYYKNNFEDGFRQDSLDLILGTYRVDEREGKQISCPLERRNVWKIFFLPLLFLFSFIMFLLTSSFASLHVDFRMEHSLYSLFWFSMSSICFVIMFYLGNEFADYPTLIRRR